MMSRRVTMPMTFPWGFSAFLEAGWMTGSLLMCLSIIRAAALSRRSCGSIVIGLLDMREDTRIFSIASVLFVRTIQFRFKSCKQKGARTQSRRKAKGCGEDRAFVSHGRARHGAEKGGWAGEKKGWGWERLTNPGSVQQVPSRAVSSVLWLG